MAESMACMPEAQLRITVQPGTRSPQPMRSAAMRPMFTDSGSSGRRKPDASGDGMSVRGLQASLPAPGQLRYQLLVMQQGGRALPEFRGRCDVLLSGQMDGKPWVMAEPVLSKPLQVRQYLRIDGVATFPAAAMVKQVEVRVLDDQGRVRATQSIKL